MVILTNVTQNIKVMLIAISRSCLHVFGGLTLTVSQRKTFMLSMRSSSSSSSSPSSSSSTTSPSSLISVLIVLPKMLIIILNVDAFIETILFHWFSTFTRWLLHLHLINDYVSTLYCYLSTLYCYLSTSTEIVFVFVHLNRACTKQHQARHPVEKVVVGERCRWWWRRWGRRGRRWWGRWFW